MKESKIELLLTQKWTQTGKIIKHFFLMMGLPCSLVMPQLHISPFNIVFFCLLTSCYHYTESFDIFYWYSSRSHQVLMLRVEGYDSVSKTTSHGKLTLVDLAGSERISRSEATGIRLVEAAAINKSLSALGQVFLWAQMW